MSVNLHKHTCRVDWCEATANHLASDGFCAYFLCDTCVRSGIVRRHMERYRGELVPVAKATCKEGCKAQWNA